MGRWRPPSEHGTALVSPAGHARLKAELDDLWRVQRPEVVRALAAAAAEGDRSENAEYTYRKKQLAGIDRRVRYLGKRLQVLRVVDTVPSDPGAVYFGAVGGLGALLSKQISAARVVAYDDLGPEALYELDVVGFPVVVIIDRHGANFHETARARWRRV